MVLSDRRVLTFQPAGQLACLASITTGIYLDNLAHKIEIIHTNCRPHSNGQAMVGRGQEAFISAFNLIPVAVMHWTEL